MQLRIIKDDEVVFKSKIFYMNVLEAINAEEEDIEEYDDVLAKLTAIVSKAENLDIDIDEDSNVTITKQDGTTKTVNVKR